MNWEYYFVGLALGGLAGKSIWNWLRSAKVKVITVIDGDTYQVVSKKGKQYRIRLRGVDCPELLQHKGPEAAQFASKLIHKKWVTARFFGKDRYGRHVADIKTTQGDLATMLVEQGWAHVLDNRKSLKLAESLAKLRRRGLWNSLWVTKPWNAVSRKKSRKPSKRR